MSDRNKGNHRGHFSQIRDKFAGKRKSSKDEQQDSKREKKGSNKSVINTDIDSSTSSTSDLEIDNMAREGQADFIKNMLAALEHEQISKLLHGKTDDLLEKMDNRLDDMDSRINQTKDQVEELQVKMDEFEQRDKNNQITISGMPEGSMTKDGVIALLNEKLGTTIEDQDVLYTLKMGRQDQENKRVKVVFKELNTKQQVSKLKPKLKNQKLWISDVLTPYRMNLAYLARKAVREKKLAQTWVYEGKIFTKANGEARPKTIRKPQDLPQ
jgi:hypothetical protein